MIANTMVFDPLGWFHSAVMQGKVFVHELHKNREISMYVQRHPEVGLDFRTNTGATGLRGFTALLTRAFRRAYRSLCATAMFLRTVGTNGINCHLLIAKARVSPFSKDDVTILRLE